MDGITQIYLSQGLAVEISLKEAVTAWIDSHSLLSNYPIISYSVITFK